MFRVLAPEGCPERGHLRCIGHVPAFQIVGLAFSRSERTKKMRRCQQGAAVAAQIQQ